MGTITIEIEIPFQEDKGNESDLSDFIKEVAAKAHGEIKNWSYSRDRDPAYKK